MTFCFCLLCIPIDKKLILPNSILHRCTSRCALSVTWHTCPGLRVELKAPLTGSGGTPEALIALNEQIIVLLVRVMPNILINVKQKVTVNNCNFYQLEDDILTVLTAMQFYVWLKFTCNVDLKCIQQEADTFECIK